MSQLAESNVPLSKAEQIGKVYLDMCQQMKMAIVNVQFLINNVGQFIFNLVDNTIVDKSIEHKTATVVQPTIK